MIVGKAIYNLLSNDAAVSAIVGTKIYPELAAADVKAPYIVYSVVSNSPSQRKEDGDGIDLANVEIYSFEDSYTDAVDLGVAVRDALDRVGGTYSGVKVQSISYTNEQMDVNEKRTLWAAIQDYQVRIKKT